MKQFRQTSAFITLSALTLGLMCVHIDAYASTAKIHSTVHAEVNGSKFPAIAVGNETYVLWRSLQAFKTPYQYLGNGKFAITGGTILGVVYQGDTYLPWYDVAPKVMATKLHHGGFNFTALPVKHDYHIGIEIDNVSIGRPAPVLVFATDGNKGIPNQMIHIQIPNTSSATVYSNADGIVNHTNQNGVCWDAIYSETAGTVQPIITWTDPSGKIHTATVDMMFTNQSATMTPPLLNENLIANVPITTFNNAVLFNAKVGIYDIPFQLDTGAFEMLLTKQIADALHLPNLGSMEVQGIGGQDEGYFSQISLRVGGAEFDNIPCMVVQNYEGPPLFGYKFFVDNGYNLVVSQKDDTMTISK